MPADSIASVLSRMAIRPAAARRSWARKTRATSASDGKRAPGSDCSRSPSPGRAPAAGAARARRWRRARGRAGRRSKRAGNWPPDRRRRSTHVRAGSRASPRHRRPRRPGRGGPRTRRCRRRQGAEAQLERQRDEPLDPAAVPVRRICVAELVDQDHDEGEQERSAGDKASQPAGDLSSESMPKTGEADDQEQQGGDVAHRSGPQPAPRREPMPTRRTAHKHETSRAFRPLALRRRQVKLTPFPMRRAPRLLADPRQRTRRRTCPPELQAPEPSRSWAPAGRVRPA